MDRVFVDFDGRLYKAAKPKLPVDMERIGVSAELLAVLTSTPQDQLAVEEAIRLHKLK